MRRASRATLAILSLTLHGDGRVWKSLSWDLMDSLHERVDRGGTIDRQVGGPHKDGERLAHAFLRKRWYSTIDQRMTRQRCEPLMRQERRHGLSSQHVSWRSEP
jgi:hypothetical protein